MRIGIPSDDGETISRHFGRARGFLVFESDTTAAEAIGYRATTHETEHGCSCNTHERASRHQSILDALTGCRVVIARGMGAQMYDDLLSCGIDVFLTDAADARAALEQYLTGSLQERTELGCDRDVARRS